MSTSFGSLKKLGKQRRFQAGRYVKSYAYRHEVPGRSPAIFGELPPSRQLCLGGPNPEDIQVIVPTIPKPLADGIYFAIRLDFEFTAGFSLVVGLLDGVYRPPDRRLRVCHPLESVVLGRKAIGEKLDQIATLIGVDRDWIDGFCDSINGVDAGKDGPYRDGYCLARWPELRRWIGPLVALPTARGFLR